VDQWHIPRERCRFVPYLPFDNPRVMAAAAATAPALAPPRTIPWLCYGIDNPYRSAVVRHLQQPILGFAGLGGGLFGEDLYQLLLRTRVVLNIPFYRDQSRPVLEIFRIAECKVFGVQVVTHDALCDDVYRARLDNIVYTLPPGVDWLDTPRDFLSQLAMDMDMDREKDRNAVDPGN